MAPQDGGDEIQFSGELEPPGIPLTPPWQPLTPPSGIPCEGSVQFWGAETPPPSSELRAAPETAEHRGFGPAAAPGRENTGRGICVPHARGILRPPAARGSPATPVMPPACTGASGRGRASRAAASLPRMPKREGAGRSSPRSSPRVAREEGTGRGPRFPFTRSAQPGLGAREQPPGQIRVGSPVGKGGWNRSQRPQLRCESGPRARSGSSQGSRGGC